MTLHNILKKVSAKVQSAVDFCNDAVALVLEMHDDPFGFRFRGCQGGMIKTRPDNFLRLFTKKRKGDSR